jgi:glucosyl-3-phosphoglycerate synthase
VKGYYERPEIGGTGGGRTTELMARPLLATLFPHLTSVRQPLGGEYAARREILEQLPFSMGYGVETGLLIDIAALVGVERLAQVDLGVRVHRNRPLDELSVQAMEILHAALRRSDVEWQPEWTHHLLRPDREPVEAQVDERPPLNTIAAYLDHRAAS